MQIELYDPLNIDLSFYQGPLDLLLELIRKKKMDIFNVRLSEICEPYLEIVMSNKNRDLESAGEFMAIASTLIYIKSKQILPVDDTEDNENEELNTEEDLRRKLIEYKIYKEIAANFDRRDILDREVFARPDFESDETPAESNIVYRNLNVYELMNAFIAVNRRAKRIRPYQIVMETVSMASTIKKMIQFMLPFVDTGEPVEFSNLIRSESNSISIFILNFCALLEIIKYYHIEMAQTQDCGNIYIYPNQLLAESSENINL